MSEITKAKTLYKSSSFALTDKSDFRLEFVLNSLSAPQLREAIFKLCVKKEITEVPKSTNLDDLRTAFNEIAGTNTEKLVSMYMAELDFPTRHIFLTSVEGADFKNLLQVVKETKLEGLMQGKQLYIRYVDDRYLTSHSIVNVLIDHEWTYEFWDENSKTRKARVKVHREEVRRHSILLRLNVSTGTVLICYSGFQGGGDRYLAGGVVYDSLTHFTRIALREQFKIECAFINLREFVRQIIGSETPKFTVEMIDSRYKKLELFMKKDSGSRSIVEEISDAIAINLNSKFEPVYEAFNKVLKQSTVEEAMLKWPGKGAKTVLRFLESGPELTFSWGPKGSDLNEQLSIAFLLSEFSKTTSDVDSVSVWTYLSSMSFGEVVTFRDLQQQTGKAVDYVKTAVLSAMEAGLLRPVYKLNTKETILDYSNDWVMKPSELKRKFRDIRGNEIDGGDLKSLLFGFQRVEPRKVQ